MDCRSACKLKTEFGVEPVINPLGLRQPEFDVEPVEPSSAEAELGSAEAELGSAAAELGEAEAELGVAEAET